MTMIQTLIQKSGSWMGVFGLAAGLAVFSLLLSSSPSAAQDVVAAARAALPDSVKESNTLNVATSLQWPPFAYKDENGEAEGIDIRLVKLLAKKLGLNAEITDVKFPSIIPGVSNGRFDIGVDQISRTEKRRKIVKYVVYFRSEYGLLVRQGVTDLNINNLCGRTLALTQGSAQIAVADRLSKECVSKGNKEISFLYYPNSADTYLAVANGRGDGFLTGKAVGLYIAKQNDKLYMTESTLDGTGSISGVVIAKANDKMHEAIRLAQISAIQDGSYQAILDDFGVGDSSLTVEDVNNPPSM